MFVRYTAHKLAQQPAPQPPRSSQPFFYLQRRPDLLLLNPTSAGTNAPQAFRSHPGTTTCTTHTPTSAATITRVNSGSRKTYERAREALRLGRVSAGAMFPHAATGFVSASISYIAPARLLRRAECSRCARVTRYMSVWKAAGQERVVTSWSSIVRRYDCDGARSSSGGKRCVAQASSVGGLVDDSGAFMGWESLNCIKVLGWAGADAPVGACAYRPAVDKDVCIKRVDLWVLNVRGLVGFFTIIARGRVTPSCEHLNPFICTS